MPFVQSDDVTLFVTEAGSAEAPPILFSNSLGTTHRMWDAVVAELSADFRCIRYDMRGHGASTRGREPFEISDFADDAIAILDNLEINRVHFAGLSLGGMTGQALAINHPERLASLTLMATTAFMPPASAWNDRAALIRREGTQAILDNTLQRWFTAGFLESAPDRLQRIASEFAGLNAQGYAACCEAIGRMDLRDNLHRMTPPTLIIAGAQDPATPVDMAHALEASIASAKLIVLDQAAHLLAVEQPEAVATHLARHVRMHHSKCAPSQTGA
jgi:3-oxoadipate enol-lactonase